MANCGLTQEKVIELHRLDAVHLEGGRCKNLLVDGSICNQPLTAHREQGEIYLILIIVPHYIYICNYQYLVLFNAHLDLYHLFIF